jgi:hypothetical protein
MRKLMFAALAALAIPANAGVALAQTAEQNAAVCKGDVARVRLSKIKPGASMADFEAAVAAHLAWYESRGYKINQTVAPVLVRKDGAPAVSPDEVMTFATGDIPPRDKLDQGWADFVAKYRAVSDLVTDKVVCMPKHH